MRYIILLILLGVFQFSCKSITADTRTREVSLVSAPDQKRNTIPWKHIFNGKDLEGWTVKIVGHKSGDNFGNTFRVENGILSIRYDGYGTDFKNRFGALYYHKKLSNYRLRIEYRFVGETAPGAPEWGYRDSGVQFHGQSAGSMKLEQPFPISLEFNLHGGNGIDERPVGEICANGIFVEVDGERNKSYCTQPTTKRTFHGDQWVVMEIEVNNGKITHYANGEEILSYENPTYDPSNTNAALMIVDGDPTVKDGYISLQSNSHPIDFRKIELMEF